MPTHWYPDTCPRGGQCCIEVTDGAAAAVQFVRACAFHDGLRVGGMTDALLYDKIRADNATRNRAVTHVAADQGIEEADVPSRVDDAGLIYVTVAANGVRRTRLQGELNTLLGTSAVIVEAP